MISDNVLFGKFEIIDTLKKDAQTGVYLANHIYLNKRIVLKTLNTQNLKDKTILHRFKREAKILAKLDHPNIIKVLDFGTENEFFYLSFEYFEGKSLREFLKHGLPDQEEFKKIFIQILSGLQYAHQQKIIHRDLKPENILIDQNLNIKIADFGLALAENEVQVTQQESIVGTPGYMSPEQIRGEILDNRTDIFSFGIIAYELLTGINPFIGKDVASTINNILFIEFEKISGPLKNHPEELKKIILKCLEKKKENRFNSVEEILNIFGIEQPLPQSIEKNKKIFNKTVLKISILSFAVILLVVLVFNYNTQEKNNEVTNNVSINTTDSTKLLTNTNSPEVKTDKIKPEQIENPISDLNTTTQQKLSETTENLDTREGKLMITCYPWAEVYIDNQKFETTPLDSPISLKTALHQIRLIHPNFPPIEKNIEITADKQYTMDVNFYKYFGFVQFKIIPWGEIIINNKKFGITPFEKPVILNPGKYVLNISNPNFGNYIDTILIQSGETLFYKLNLNSITNWHNN